MVMGGGGRDFSFENQKKNYRLKPAIISLWSVVFELPYLEVIIAGYIRPNIIYSFVISNCTNFFLNIASRNLWSFYLISPIVILYY